MGNRNWPAIAAFYMAKAGQVTKPTQTRKANYCRVFSPKLEIEPELPAVSFAMWKSKLKKIVRSHDMPDEDALT